MNLVNIKKSINEWINKNNQDEIKLMEIMKDKWEICEKNKVFNYIVKENETRILENNEIKYYIQVIKDKRMNNK